ncbi:alanine racemase [Sporosalibacterium faouarense]|uniref:alanine racemase n=1 Tax=Sporosalibacterium faouarense TaxID=516123 RepID=UPI00141D6B86|nr:alanine racemase [Sporosalibacterium faouarense]MTI48657.1 alanine racemase [Bacillota bacterium]
MSLLENTRPVWVEINLDNLAHNINEVVKNTQKGTLITAVVKADGYGHGASVVAKTFLENGADRLAVATLSEAIELRENGIDDPILILGYTPTYQAASVLKYGIIQTIYTYDQAHTLSLIAKELDTISKVHIKIDTGMGRLGYKVDDETIDEIEKIRKLPNVEVEGIYTHFAVADEENKEETKEQFSKFMWIVNRLQKKNIEIPIKHVSNSAAIIDLKEYNMDMVRAGIMLYGLYPSKEVKIKNVDLKPAMTLKACISNVKTVESSKGISYGHIYVTNKITKVGTLPLGYADGYTRMLTSKAEVTIKGKRVPIIGRICMDQCMVDITSIGDVNIGDEVILFGNGKNNTPHIDEIAEKLDTINYEIVCMISRRVPRVYVKNGEIIDIKDYLLE